MSQIKYDNDLDLKVDDEIFVCLDPDSPKSFFLFAGAGSGKTRTLVNVLNRFKEKYGLGFRLRRQRVAIITYTNAAADEIIHRLDFDPIFNVSTIHSFSWELIGHFTDDIRQWLKVKLNEEITELNLAQGKSRDLNNKTSIERARKIDSKTKRLTNLDGVFKFTYNPNGDNTTKDSLNHSEVIEITADFINKENLMQEIVTDRFPIILIDESQDTKKGLIDAFFALQSVKKAKFSLGLFGDTMQRIYADGKENLGREIPKDWLTPQKKMNHRSNKRIINLVNDIRKQVDEKVQFPRLEKNDGHVRLFISPRTNDKAKTEEAVLEKMTTIASDPLWKDLQHVKTLILEHHMAAIRMGFYDFFEPLYALDILKTSLLEGTSASIGFFTRTVLPLVEASENNNDFAIAKIVKQSSDLLKKNELVAVEKQFDQLQIANLAVQKLLGLWENGNDPTALEILTNVAESKLFPIPAALYPLAHPRIEQKQNEELTEIKDDALEAWRQALNNPFSQIRNYNQYLGENSRFGTHQGVKGLEYPRVMVIIDDEEAKGFMFSYDKLFGTKELTTTDKNNLKEGKETGIDRTRRLFYVACSRAKESLAIIAYSDDPTSVLDNVLKYGWFNEGEVEML